MKIPISRHVQAPTSGSSSAQSTDKPLGRQLHLRGGATQTNPCCIRNLTNNQNKASEFGVGSSPTDTLGLVSRLPRSVGMHADFRHACFLAVLLISSTLPQVNPGALSPFEDSRPIYVTRCRSLTGFCPAECIRNEPSPSSQTRSGGAGDDLLRQSNRSSLTAAAGNVSGRTLRLLLHRPDARQGRCRWVSTFATQG